MSHTMKIILHTYFFQEFQLQEKKRLQINFSPHYFSVVNTKIFSNHMHLINNELFNFELCLPKE